MSHWNHRVVRKLGYLGVHECFYGRSRKIPEGVTEHPVRVYGETIEDLRQTLEWMLEALDRPVLDYEDIDRRPAK